MGDEFKPSPFPQFPNGNNGNQKNEVLYKILVIGELGSGKTSLIKRYVHQFFSQHYRATIGVDFALKVINYDANTIIRLQLWDIAGQVRAYVPWSGIFYLASFFWIENMFRFRIDEHEKNMLLRNSRDLTWPESYFLKDWWWRIHYAWGF